MPLTNYNIKWRNFLAIVEGWRLKIGFGEGMKLTYTSKKRFDGWDQEFTSKGFFEHTAFY